MCVWSPLGYLQLSQQKVGPLVGKRLVDADDGR